MMDSIGLLYYTCGTHPPVIEDACRRHLLKVKRDYPLVAVSLNKQINFGDHLVVMQGKRSSEMMHRQILTGLECVTTDIVFFCESDVLYHPSHFDFRPPRPDVFYYNENTWKVDAHTGRALFYYTKQLSGMCAYTDLALQHYRRRLERIERVGRYEHSMGYEPGCHQAPRGVDDSCAERWMSGIANIDIRHDKTYTRNRWSQDQFRDKRTCQGWTWADGVEGWGKTEGRFYEFLKEVTE